MDNYITHIIVPNVVDNEYIDLAYPVDNKNVINVLCGPNNSGKSFILRTVLKLLETKNYNNNFNIWGYSLMCLNNSMIKSILLRPTDFKQNVGFLSKTKNLNKIPKEYDSRIFQYKLFKDIIEPTIDGENLQENKNYIIDKFDTNESRIYQFENYYKNEVIAFFQNTFKVKLGFRKPKDFQLELLILSDLNLPYGEWSDGQKALFYLALCIIYYKPNILLLDELENHLHPELISNVLDFIKNRIPQTIIGTHHPHIIFSNYIDKVFYIEKYSINKRKKLKNINTIREFKKTIKQAAPMRKIETINNSFSKLTATYKLFDNRDSQLLKLANYIFKSSDIFFYSTILEIFENQIVGNSNKKIPDQQTQDIASFLIDDSLKELTILDYGAGIGRVIKELNKYSFWKLPKEIKWVAWEPNIENREKLRKETKNEKFEILIPNELSEIKDSSCDITIVANVLHECPPNQIVDNFFHIINKLKKKTGYILITEIYPLLKVEKYAVPYAREILTNFLQQIGYKCDYIHFIKNYSQAYCIKAMQKNCVNDKSIIKKNILKVWNNIKKDILLQYFNRSGINDYLAYNCLIQDLTAIISMEAYNLNMWQ